MTLTAELARTLWVETHCRDLIKNHPIIEIDSQTTVNTACGILVKNGISSAPVYNKETQSYVGMLDYRDIVDYVLYVFKKKRLTPIPEDQVWGITEIIEKAQAGEPPNAQFVADLSNKNPFYSVFMDSTLMDVAEIFGESNGVHRVNVVDENGKVQGIISQSDLGRYLFSRKPELKSIFDKSLQSLGIAHGPVVHISTEGTVLEALEKMSKYAVSSIAVVEPNGAIYGNISMADIRFIFQNNHFDRLWMHVSQFVSLALNQKGLENQGKDRFPVFTGTPDLALGFALEKILVTHTHRLWIVDSHDKLTGVCSLTDIIRQFSPPKDME